MTLKKIFFKLMNNTVLGKTMENVRNIDTLNLSQHKKKKLFSIRTKLSYYKLFHRTSVSNRTRKKQILMNNLGLSILELSKILMCEFWYDYVTPKIL